MCIRDRDMMGKETMENTIPAGVQLGSREEKRAFYKRAAAITGPIALQNFMDAAVGSADVIMLSFVSQAALAASSLAGQVMFVLQMMLYGCLLYTSRCV